MRLPGAGCLPVKSASAGGTTPHRLPVVAAPDGDGAGAGLKPTLSATARTPLVLQAAETFRLGPGHLVTAGSRLTVEEGDGLAELLADLQPDAQRRRFGRVLLQVVSEPDVGRLSR
jgi:hypothetical protein